MFSFFDESYQTPQWFKQKMTRRNLLKSAAGATAVASLPRYAFANTADLALIIKKDPWLTLDAVLNHLLPTSESGPGAIEIQATNYLYQTVMLQPIEESEKEFINKGVGWLNGYSQSQLKKNFVLLNGVEKENMLRAISGSSAGQNWLNTLLNYIFEAMLSPPIYGGNPNGIGWSWLKHQGGFPLPQKGKRYYEIPSRYTNISKINPEQNKNKTLAANTIPVKNVPVEEKVKS